MTRIGHRQPNGFQTRIGEAIEPAALIDVEVDEIVLGAFVKVLDSVGLAPQQAQAKRKPIFARV